MNEHKTRCLPSGWTSTILGEVLTVVRGVTYKKEDARNTEATGFLPVLRATNIGEQLDFEELVYVPSKCVSRPQMLREGDIVIAASSGSKSVVGKAAPLRHGWYGSFGAFCYGLRPHQGVHPLFIANFLRTVEYRNRVSELASGVNINNLRQQHIDEMPFRLAPAQEQHRIVEEIEKQFSRLDAAVAALKRVRANLKRYRAAVLRAACEGRLVPTEAELARQERRDYEPADVLLQRILTERRARWEAEQLAKLEAQGRLPLNDTWKARYQEPAAPDVSGLPELPEGWCWTSLDQCFAVERGRFSIRPRNDPRYYGGIIPFIQIGDLPRNGGAISTYTQTLNGDGLKVSKMFGKGTVLIAIVGATIGNTGILTFDSCCPDSLVALQSADEAFLHYAEFYLRLTKQEVRSSGYASGGQPNINLALLQPYPIPLPPANELKRIIDEIERRLSIVEAVEVTVAADLKRAERLRQSILQRAFSGKLVPQDPNDEPASVLLERIRAERANIASPYRFPRLNKRVVDDPQSELPL